MRKRSFLLIMLVCMLLFFVPSFIFIESNLKEPLMNIARVRVKQVATQAINKAISEQVARKSESEKLIDWKMNGDETRALEIALRVSATTDTIESVEKVLCPPFLYLHSVADRVRGTTILIGRWG